MPNLKIELFIPEHVERADQAGIISRGVKLQGVKGINTVTPGPNDELFANTNGNAVLDLSQLSEKSHGFFEAGQRYVLTIEKKEADAAEKV